MGEREAVDNSRGRREAPLRFWPPNASPPKGEIARRLLRASKGRVEEKGMI